MKKVKEIVPVFFKGENIYLLYKTEIKNEKIYKYFVFVAKYSICRK